MGGLGVFVWLAIGAAAGWVISRVVARFDVGRHPSNGSRAQALAARIHV